MVFELVARIEEILLEIILVVQHQFDACEFASERLHGFHAIAALRRVGPPAPKQDRLPKIARVAPCAALHELHQPGSVRARLGAENPIGGATLRRIRITPLSAQSRRFG